MPPPFASDQSPFGPEQPAPRVLLDTSVLAPEPLWLWFLALTESVPAPHRPRLFASPAIARELRPALRRIDPRLTRAQVDTAARLRLASLERAIPPTPEAPKTHPTPPTSVIPASGAAARTSPRAHVLDLDDAHLDDVARTLDVLVTDDVHAFAPIPTTIRGYELLSADEFLCALTDTFVLSIPEAADRYRAHLARAAREVGIEPQAGSASHRLRRSRARRFAKRVVRSAKASSLH